MVIFPLSAGFLIVLSISLFFDLFIRFEESDSKFPLFIDSLSMLLGYGALGSVIAI